MPAKKRCFVISPIGAPGSEVRAHADDVFNYIIEPVTKQLGYDTERGDHMARPGRISDQMYERILHDDLLIAVLTFQNPNVYYELAIAHSAARPLIILCEASHDNLPFDIKDQRVIFYDLRPRSLFDGTYKKQLEKAILQIESGAAEPEVPFRPNLTPLGGLGESFRVFERFTDTVSAGSLPLKLIRETERSLRLSGITLFSLGQYPDVRPALKEIAERGAEVKILIMSEQNPALASMLNADMKNYSLKVRDEIVRSFEMWTEMRRSMPRLSVRKLRQGIVYQQLFMNESRMIYTPYNMSTTTYYSATIQTDHRSPLYTAQRHEFDFLWERSEDGGARQNKLAAKAKRKKSAPKRSRRS
jgi:sugar-specific transcriptional regulator TrmB